ncbi:hypothetical protein AKJ09_00413 [Labilithrix luteola]|uniref:Uncharacterized protein n=1 Tax=Labilithrix luteola TaxID=1391654 RepID=A0A0K1PKX5_9BACT|nr:hypothetical protein AKJ09_00413 [Labilithrix luteola]
MGLELRGRPPRESLQQLSDHGAHTCFFGPLERFAPRAIAESSIPEGHVIQRYPSSDGDADGFRVSERAVRAGFSASHDALQNRARQFDAAARARLRRRRR